MDFIKCGLKYDENKKLDILLSTDDIALIYTVDWFLDRVRTAINIWGDSAGCGIVAHLAKDKLQDEKNHEPLELETHENHVDSDE